jgi:hypothetical protein
MGFKLQTRHYNLSGLQESGTSYLRKIWDKKDFLIEGERGFRPG